MANSETGNSLLYFNDTASRTRYEQNVIRIQTRQTFIKQTRQQQKKTVRWILHSWQSRTKPKKRRRYMTRELAIRLRDSKSTRTNIKRTNRKFRILHITYCARWFNFTSPLSTLRTETAEADSRNSHNKKQFNQHIMHSGKLVHHSLQNSHFCTTSWVKKRKTPHLCPYLD